LIARIESDLNGFRADAQVMRKFGLEKLHQAA